MISRLSICFLICLPVVVATGGKAFAQQTFKDGLLTAWNASAESEPFGTIKGDFDLSGADNRLWKTTLHVPPAASCVLIKGQNATTSAQPSTPLWTFACRFPFAAGQSGTYEYVINSVKESLDLPYRPDESVTDWNQVVFEDTTRPLWRVLVSKFNSMVILWIAPRQFTTLQLAGVPGLSQTVQGNSTTLSSLRAEVEEIERIGRFTALPQPQVSGGGSGSGSATRVIKNDTSYELRVVFTGPTDREITIQAGGTQTIVLPPGQYKVLGRVSAPNVIPFLGAQDYRPGETYTSQFFLK